MLQQRLKKPPFSSALLILSLVILWQVLMQMHLIPSYLLPSPLEIWSSYQDEWSSYSQAFLSTLMSTLEGFALSALVGLMLAVLMSLFEGLTELLLPLFVFFQTVPIIAIAPMMVIWFGFGKPTVVASSFIVSFFPVLANALVGLRSPRREWLDLFFVARASRWQQMFRLRLPASLPYLLAGLQVAFGLSVVGAIVGEFVGGGGLGGVIDSARTQQRLDLVFGSVILSSVIGWLGIMVLNLIKRFFYRYFSEEQLHV